VNYTATYTFDFRDYRSMERGLSTRLRFGWLWKYLFFGWVFALAWFYFYDNHIYGLITKHSNTNSQLIALSALSAGCVVILLATLLRAFEQFSFKRSLAGKQFIYAIKPQWIKWSCGDLSGTTEWHTVKTVVKRPESLVLLIDRNEVIVLPARAFASALEFEAATEFAATRVSELRATSAGPGDSNG
jgi:YcxB-like protein